MLNNLPTNDIHKEVIKPWGKEVWIALTDKYCYKRIYLNASQSTSLQYHEFKLETNYVISGRGTLYINETREDGSVISRIIDLEPNVSVTIPPGIIHQVTAITDLVLQEVSTPEVDDCIRIDDEWGRGNGRIEEEHEL